MRGHATARDLIQASGLVMFRTRLSALSNRGDDVLFRVVTSDYLLELGFTKTDYYIERDGQRLRLPLPPTRSRTGYTHCLAVWQVDRLQLLAMDESDYQALSSLSPAGEKVGELKKRMITLDTPATLPPNSLVVWARKLAIAPVMTYASIEELNETVTSSLQSIEDRVSTVGAYNAFWDIGYEGTRIVSRKPKHETDIHLMIHALLFDIGIAKNLEIARDYTVGGGKLDFLISGPLRTGEMLRVGVEFKHAHSDDLSDGLLKQLPAYMKAKGCVFGVYCVLYFKGRHFTEPRKYDRWSLVPFLQKQAISAGLTKVRVLLLDLSHPEPPSRL